MRPLYNPVASRRVVRPVGEMKVLAKQAEAYLAKIGDLRTVLAMLKVEIAKREKKA